MLKLDCSNFKKPLNTIWKAIMLCFTLLVQRNQVNHYILRCQFNDSYVDWLVVNLIHIEYA